MTDKESLTRATGPDCDSHARTTHGNGYRNGYRPNSHSCNGNPDRYTGSHPPTHGHASGHAHPDGSTGNAHSNGSSHSYRRPHTYPRTHCNGRTHRERSTRGGATASRATAAAAKAIGGGTLDRKPNRGCGGYEHACTDADRTIGTGYAHTSPSD